MKRKLNVLVACESSGTVRDAFRTLGHNAWSCDLLPCDLMPCDADDLRYHVQGDVLALLRGDTMAIPAGRDYREKRVGFDPSKWDLMIGHPPCTYLANSGVRWLYKWVPEHNPAMPGALVQRRVEERWKKLSEAAWFFGQLWKHATRDIPHVAIENPIMHGHGADLIGAYANCGPALRPDQIVQPWMFGHPCTKATGLYLRNLPKLEPTNIVAPSQGSVMHKLPPSKDRWKLRSKTFQGIADAMAAQWSAYVLAEKDKADNARWLKGTPPGYND